MKPILATPEDNLMRGKLFLVKEINRPAFDTEFHFHEACQLVYVMESSGRRIIGDNVEYFESGELTFVGSNVPHVWYNEERYFKQKRKLQARSLAMYIQPQLLAGSLAPFGNIAQLDAWLQKARRGIQFYGSCKEAIVALMKQLLAEEGMRRASSFMELIVLMMDAKEYRLLASNNYENLYKDKDQTRMGAVFKYIFRNFRREIPLSEIAAVASLNTYSFCRFFKSRTQQSFVDFVNELRISYACRLMQEKEMNISELASRAGFNHTTHFNRLFKRMKGITPKEYRKSLHQLKQSPA
ncbi:MAG TPA: AraC family transcriptional regulator [Chitinophaga sp.]|uniref:AraC family transcriptional regulator n=1 Tax=Chitinophaga sp. TaxID=1869181 RepID=UPI002B8869F0|nr:AraC family transcriptional regulator [Chitinophaga sp.]HVI49028.1 AraC family transcriptional regulator [Chitinophaga sp.]